MRDRTNIPARFRLKVLPPTLPRSSPVRGPPCKIRAIDNSVIIPGIPRFLYRAAVFAVPEHTKPRIEIPLKVFSARPDAPRAAAHCAQAAGALCAAARMRRARAGTRADRSGGWPPRRASAGVPPRRERRCAGGQQVHRIRRLISLPDLMIGQRPSTSGDSTRTARRLAHGDIT